MLTEEQKEDLRAQGGRVICEREDETNEETIIQYVFRKPTSEQWTRFITNAADKRKNPQTVARRLVQDCILHPGLEEVNAYMDANPPSAQGFVADIQDACGLSDRQVPKKL